MADRVLPDEGFESSIAGRPIDGRADATRGTAGSPPRPSEAASDELTSNVAELPAVEGAAKLSIARKRGMTIRLITYQRVGKCVSYK